MAKRVTLNKRRRVGFSTRTPYWYDAAAADKVIWFIENLCTHSKGELAGQPVHLELWERDMVENLFGWKRKNSTDPQRCIRKFRSLWLEIPRKNGKSTLAACLALVLLYSDGEKGAEIYSAAGDRDQASIVFDVAKTMVEQEPMLLERASIFGGMGGMRRSLVHKTTGGVYRVLSSDAHTKHGLNAHGIVVDEVHVQKNRHLIDTLRTSIGSRRQPLEIFITTAGYDRESICWEMHDYADKVIQGIIQDETLLPYIYAASARDDWTCEKTWRKANPNLGVSLSLDYLKQECEHAKNAPAYQNTFRRLHLNQWTEQDIRFLAMRHWDKCAGQLPDLEGRACYAGLDLASTIDLSALVLVFGPDADGVYDVLPFFWVPEDTLKERCQRDRVPYDLWAQSGHLFITPGQITDYDVIRRDINALSEKYNIQEIAADPWNATQLITQLDADGFTVFAHRQGFVSFQGPTKQLEALARAKRLRHGGHPVLRWMASNLTVKQDPAGNLKPDKQRSTEKIDGMVALIMALGRAQIAETPLDIGAFLADPVMT